MGFDRVFTDKQLVKLEEGECRNPHSLLGMHRMGENNETGFTVRVFCPAASSITLVHIQDSSKRYVLTPRGNKGIFEGVIKQRKHKFLYKLQCKDSEGNRWTYIDPYQFQTGFSEEELQGFSTGTYYEIYNQMGANFKVIEGIKGVQFAVWAPHAKRVSVIGPFNQWDGRRHAMRFIESHGIWEIFIPEIEEMEAYKYEIKTQEDILLYKADPYAKYSQLRPDTASRVFDPGKYKWKDKKWLEKRGQKAYYKEPVSIYEVHMGSWKRHPDGAFYTYREAAEELSRYIKEMGYTHIELLGIIEHPYDGSWGYQVTGYFAPTSRYGTPDDFKYFVDVMHKHDIGVLLDWVPAHFPKDAFALEKFDGTALYEHVDEERANHPQWGTLIFDYGKPQVDLFLIASALSWLDHYHIDGLRVDAVASMLYLDYGREGQYKPNQYGGRENLEAIAFFKKLNTEIYSRFLGVMTIAEESTSFPKVSHPVHEGGLGFGFKWNMGWMNDFLAYMKIDPYYRKYNHEKITFSLMYAFSENYIQALSHDEVVHEKSSLIYKMPGNEWQKFANLRAAYGYMFMHPGKKMLFMGNEFGQTTEWNENRELDWELLRYKPHACTLQYVKDLNAFYKTNKCLWELGIGYDNFEWIDCDNKDQSIISFMRKGESIKEKLIIVANFTPVTYENYRIGVPLHAIYTEVLNSDALVYDGTGVVNGTLPSEDKGWHGNPYSLLIKIPPLGICVFEISHLLKES